MIVFTYATKYLNLGIFYLSIQVRNIAQLFFLLKCYPRIPYLFSKVQFLVALWMAF